MLKKIVKKLMHFPENCIFVKIVTFGARQLLEQPKHSHRGSAYDVQKTTGILNFVQYNWM